LKVNYYKDETITENRIDVFYQTIDPEVSGIMDYLSTYEMILGKNDTVTKKIFPSEIYYLEIVERRCYAYLEHEVYQIEFNLKSFMDCFSVKGFIQIGKSILVNVYKLEKIKTDFNMKMRLFMSNGEILILNRSYKKSFMEYLKKLQEVADETIEQK